MSPTTILLIVCAYFALLLFISFLTSRRQSDASNAAFFTGNRKSPWYIVAFGMIGTSISGVTFVSVPGMVTVTAFQYLQTCLGFIFGYALVAFILLPIYYRLRLVTIYGYLNRRFGTYAYRSGAIFFCISKITGAAARLFLAVSILHYAIFQPLGVPFPLSVALLIFAIWLYTFKSGIRTIVFTDALQTFFLLLALILILCSVLDALDWSPLQACQQIYDSTISTTLNFSPASPMFFPKQFFSGIFIVVVMTGLDQDMMQKNLSIATLKQSQKNMMTYGAAFLPVNLLFLSLGALLVFLAQAKGILLPDQPDHILPFFATQILPPVVTVCFFIGIAAAAFSSADSALTSLTTSVSIDLFNIQNRPERLRRPLRMFIHIAIAIVFFLLILAIHTLADKTSIIDTIYRLASYTYGPLLGLFAFGLYTKRRPRDTFIPVIALFSPAFCGLIDYICKVYFDYAFSYELLILNALITFSLLWSVSKK
ncbi:MAG: sodium:solute symporter [Paludibacteraceae bacterium]|nr:sodium:solute symporter [Paludibacteraceae bacterium]